MVKENLPSVISTVWNVLTGEEELPPKKVTRYQVAMKTQVAEKCGSSGK